MAYKITEWDQESIRCTSQHCTKTYIPINWESIGYADGNVLNPALIHFQYMPNGFPGWWERMLLSSASYKSLGSKEDRSTRSKSLSSKMLTEKVATQSDTCDIAASDAEEWDVAKMNVAEVNVAKVNVAEGDVVKSDLVDSEAGKGHSTGDSAEVEAAVL